MKPSAKASSSLLIGHNTLRIWTLSTLQDSMFFDPVQDLQYVQVYGPPFPRHVGVCAIPQSEQTAVVIYQLGCAAPASRVENGGSMESVG